MPAYCLAGFTVDSEIALQGMRIAYPAGKPAEITIRRGKLPWELEKPTQTGPTWQMDADRFLLRIPDVARFLLTGGHRIDFETENDTPPDDVAIFVAGTVLGILLHQRGQMVLHASAVDVHGKAVLFCGTSASGKSTLAAALVDRGFPLLADDLAAFAFDAAGRASVHSDGRNLKLWTRTIEELSLGARQGTAVRRRLHKFHVEPAIASNDALPIGAIYALRETRPPHVSGIQGQNAVDAALTLRRCAYRPALVVRMDQQARYFHAATRIADAAGVFILTRPFEFAAMPDVLASLQTHWREIGLTPSSA